MSALLIGNLCFEFSTIRIVNSMQSDGVSLLRIDIFHVKISDIILIILAESRAQLV